MTFLARTLGTLALGLLTALPASAQFFSADEVVEVSLMPGYRLDGDRHMAAIRIRLAPGWKTYWRAPGEGGVPTILRLTQAEGVSGMAIHWPRPQVFFTNGLRSIGYEGDVILPVEFAMSTDGTAEVAGHLDLGVCQDVCMPISVDLGGLLPAQTLRDGAIAAALSDRPLTAAEAGAGPVTCAVEPISDGLRVTVRAQVPDTGNDETMVVEHRDPMIWVSEAVGQRQGGWLIAVADVIPADHGPFALNRSDLRITVIGSRQAVELNSCTG
ncbi:protein-disulfide reductase DsbD domain-containing protein [Hasllibacter sp. MH4015]|uniref:protein-disulfide reductase DsbD domain-containing protein n=1 Tax=Hasllibacter sp. MH4015 TaxID=2854029 RepID=UPI001CD6B8C0|nr:protein-disulfide reductase DsbD domain-containing protein [Hasllibacter sp. MH4015]